MFKSTRLFTDVWLGLVTSFWPGFQAPRSLGTPALHNTQACSTMGQKPRWQSPLLQCCGWQLGLERCIFLRSACVDQAALSLKTSPLARSLPSSIPSLEHPLWAPRRPSFRCQWYVRYGTTGRSGVLGASNDNCAFRSFLLHEIYMMLCSWPCRLGLWAL